jgi:hypothetical protein
MFYYPGNGDWWLGTLNTQNQFLWNRVDNSSGFGNISKDPFWTGDFVGNGHTDVMFYSPGDQNWWLGTLNTLNQITWTLATNTSSYGNVEDGRPLWVSPFNGGKQTDVMFFWPWDDTWRLGIVGAGNALVWSPVGTASVH